MGKDRHVQRISEFLIGLLFGIGLLLSGMTDPGKVIGFLDLAGAWDPDRRLVAGSLLFGVGWGLAGFCPGPALVSLAAGQPKAAAFVLAMVIFWQR
jgi:uncharacterized membrane protein YedE/YeeE